MKSKRIKKLLNKTVKTLNNISWSDSNLLSLLRDRNSLEKLLKEKSKINK